MTTFVLGTALAPAALAAGPTCQNDPSETTQAGAGLTIFFNCSTSTGVTYHIVGNPSHGTLDTTDIANGDVTYTTTSNTFTGTDSFTFNATDSGGTSNTATVTITVTPENQCLDISDQQTPSNTALQVFFSCASGTGATETYSIVSNPGHGTLNTTDIANGDVTYTPTAGYDGPDSFTYRANDGVMTSNTATVTIGVGNTCVNQQLTTGEDGQSPLFIALQCATTNSGTETYSLVSGPSHGFLSGTISSGTANYVPAHGFVGTDSFTFRANDGTQTSNTATVTITVTPPPPSCQSISTSTPENTPVSIPLRCTSPAGEMMTLSVPSGQGPSDGTLGAINSTTQTVTYTPNSGYVSDDTNGPDSFQYIATDTSNDASSPATVDVWVGISCSSDSEQTPENEPVEISLSCTGPSGVSLTLATVAAPGHGTLGTIDQAGQQVLYTPVAGFHGADSFTFRASGGGFTSATVTISITVQAVVLACSGDSVSTPENTPITLPSSCTNRAGQTLTLSTAPSGSPAHGTISFNNTNQTITYTPTSGFTGQDAFTYEATDGSGATPTAQVNVTVVGVSCSPSAEQTSVGEPVTVGLDCTGPDGTPLTLAIATQPTHGSLGQIIQLDGTVLYTPSAGFAGTDSFTFTASGGGHTTTPVKATITISSPTPLCSGLSASTPPGTSVTIPLQCGGPNGQTLTLSIQSAPSYGLLGSVDNTHRTVTYTPKTGFVGQDEFSYQATGGGMTSFPATVTITVGPTCSDTGDLVTAGEPAELSLQCVDGRGQALTLSITGQPSHGTLGPVDSGLQQVLYTPATGYVGPDAITYEANDGTTTSNVATDSIDVQPAVTSPQPLPAPSCQDQNLATPASTALTVPLHCVDPAGKTLTLLKLSGAPDHGTLGAITQGSSASVVYTPVSGYTGTDVFEYEASDGSAVSNAAFVSIQVGLTCSDTGARGGTAQPIPVSLNCTGPGTLTYQIVSPPSDGTLGAISSQGVVNYTPNSGFTGADTFTYRVTSGGASSNVATATVGVTTAGPACQDVTVSMAENTGANTPVSVPLTCTEQGKTLTLFTGSGFGGPQDGTLGAINTANDTVPYTPVNGFEGTDTFGYGASDGTMTAGASVTVTVGLNCSDGQQQVPENQATTIQLSCLAPNGTTPTIGIVKSPAHGTLGTVNQSAQTVTFTPTSGFAGTDTFTIDASGGGQTSQVAVISLDIAQPAPSCSDINVSDQVNTATTVPLQCTGANGATLTLLVPSGDGPSDGTLGTIDQATQTVQYTPDAGFQGDDFFEFEASDGNHLSQLATVDVTVSNGPTCAPVTASTNEGVATSIQLSCSGGTGTPTYSILSQPAHGTLSNINASTGAVTYTPNAGYSGPDTFTYGASAGGQGSNPATVSITVNPPPSCSDVSATTNENVAVSVQLSCVDSAGRTLTLSTVSSPTHGTLGTINQTTQTVQYTPTSGFSGSDSFTYTATAGGQTSNTATASITVNAAPGCNDVSVSTDAGHVVTVPLHCTDPQNRTLTLSVASAPSHGTLGTISQTAQTVQYTPTTGYTGADTFTYNATVTGGQTSNTATVAITVNPTPTCSAVSASTAENQPVTVQLSCTGGTGTLTLANGSTSPAHGTLGAINSTSQTVQYTPTTGYTGPDSFTYQASDAQGATSPAATVSMTVTPPPPVCNDVSVSTDVGKAVSVPLHCTDQLGRTLSLAVVSAPTHGSLGTINQTAQTAQYTPTAGYTGPDSFTYKATTTSGQSQSSNTATVSLTVNAPPACGPVGASTDAGHAVTVQLSCTGGTGTMTLAKASGPSHGTLGAINSAAQTVQYTPTPGYTGTDSFTYQASDSQGGASAPATASITVDSPPTCNAAHSTTNENQTVTVQLACSGGTGGLTLGQAGGPSHGSLGAFNSAAETVKYTPASNFSGTDSFTYQATDGQGVASAPATVTITVNAASPPPPPPPPPSNKLTSLTLPSTGTVVKGVLSLTITFQGSGSGTATAFIKVLGSHHRKVMKSIGSTSFTLSGGGTKTITIRLNALGKSKLKAGHGKLRAILKLIFNGGSHSPITISVTLKGH